MNSTNDNTVEAKDKSTPVANDNIHFDKGDYDRLYKKPAPPNEQSSDLKLLQERLEEYKKDPTGKPWESAFEKLSQGESGDGLNVC